MKNHERFATPYLLATGGGNSVNLAGLCIGAANITGAVVCIKTNGGALVVLPAGNVTTRNFIDNQNTNTEAENEEDL